MKQKFENYLREKRIRIEFIELPPYVLGLLGSLLLIYVGCRITIDYGFIFVRGPFGSYLVFLGVAFLLFNCWVISHIMRGISCDSKISEKEIIFLDQKSFSYNVSKIDDLYLYQFLTEPYINQVILLVDTFKGDPYKEAWTKLHFNFPASMAYFRKHKKEYWVCQEQYLADPDKTDQKNASMRFSGFRSKKNKKGRDWHRYRYCVTFEKAQALNRVFDLVSPPVFKVTVNEKQRRLISIHPIEGKEYPEEVYELLEKINGMYP